MASHSTSVNTLIGLEHLKKIPGYRQYQEAHPHLEKYRLLLGIDNNIREIQAIEKRHSGSPIVEVPDYGNHFKTCPYALVLEDKDCDLPCCCDCARLQRFVYYTEKLLNNKLLNSSS